MFNSARSRRRIAFRASSLRLALIGCTLQLLLAVCAEAAPIVLSFDGLQPNEGVAEFYNGGFGSLGSGPGPGLGVSFSPGWTLTPAGLPPPAIQASGMAIVNIHGGWVGTTSWYALTGNGVAVRFFDQEDGLGSLIGALTIGPAAFFTPAGATLPMFRSIVFDSMGTYQVDTLVNGAFVVPEPETWRLVAFGMLGWAVVVRRSRARRATP